MKARDMSLDLMRLIGVLIIMLAHSNPPEWLFQLRNFGTPLLIVASALTYSVIYRNRELVVVPFIKKRLSRLIFPAWLFLLFFFGFFYISFSVVGMEFPFSLSSIASSFLFYNGIGFVWIFKVYIMLALMTPFALTVNRNVKSGTLYFGGLLVAYLFYEMFYYYCSPLLSGLVANVFDNVIFVIFPYAIFYLYGLRLSALSSRRIAFVSIVSFFVFMCYVFINFKETGEFVPTQNFKYPPRLYYLSYALSVLNLIYLVCRTFKDSYSNSKVITWLSANSLWVYLWHIMAFYLWEFIVGENEPDLVLCLIQTVFLITFGVVFAKIQLFVMAYISEKCKSNFSQKLALLLS